jgi:signal transduction histidine kinase
MNFRAMHWRLMTAFALFTLVVTLIFGLFAMAFVYSVEDTFFERQLGEEAARKHQHHAGIGVWLAPRQSFIRLHESAATLPADMKNEWSQYPARNEFAGTDGRHYHVLPLGQARMPTLVAEVSGILIVRPMRNDLLTWLAGWGAAMVCTALILGAWLAQRISAPLEALARDAARADPANLPQALSGSERGDEVGVVANALQALMRRTRSFIEREQAFTRDASHELRTPLAVMGMALERARGGATAEPDAKAQLEAAASAARHMTQTVNTLLMLARETAVDESCDCALLPVIEQWVLANELQLSARHVRLDIAMPVEARIALPPPVLQLIVANLLGNAVTHGTPGGAIHIRHEDDALLISNSSVPIPARAGEVEVKGEASAGFGMGLSIVRRLLARHGATLEIEHADGVTTVRVHTTRAHAETRQSPEDFERAP